MHLCRARVVKKPMRSARRIENHVAAVALGYFAYNFIKVHRTLRMAPTMAAGATTRLLGCAEEINACRNAKKYSHLGGKTTVG